MAEQDDVLHLIDDSGTVPEVSPVRRWKIAVIDDDQAVHEGTRFALSDYNLHGATLEILSAYSAAEGRILMRDNPDIRVEFVVDYGLSNIVADRYDAGVRSGEQVAKDMIALRIAPDMQMAVVGAPSYFKGRPEPKKPQDLVLHNCINLRLPTHGSLYAWEFEKGNRELKVRVEGQLTCNGTAQSLNGALAGLGLAYVPEGMVEAHIAQGQLKRVLADWCPPFSGYHLYYPSRRQSSAAFALLVDALRYRPLLANEQASAPRSRAGGAV